MAVWQQVNFRLSLSSFFLDALLQYVIQRGLILILTFQEARGALMASTCLLSPPPPTMMQSNSYKKVDLGELNVTRISVTSRGNKKWVLRSGPSAADLTEEERQCWDSCRQAMVEFKFDRGEEDKILGKAFGQIHSPYWGEERAKEVPKYEAVNAMLNYLRSLSLTDDDLAKILKKFPEVLGCSLEDEVRNNVVVLEKEWGITGKSLRSLLLRNPKVLGYNVDCKGSCVAQCTRCWVRF